MFNKFDVVIVNWNSDIQLKDCIRSIMDSSFDHELLNKVVVVDNDSKDQSIEMAESLNFKKLRVIKNKENLGFGKACNIGAENSTADFILFLNPDAMVYEDTFSKLFSYIKDNNTDSISVYGVKLIGDAKKTQRSCARFPKLHNFLIRVIGLNKLNSKIFKTYHMEDWDHDESRFVDHVIGAFYFIDRTIFKLVNGFDERYFVYFEDLDLSKKVQEADKKVYYLAGASAYHKGGGTSEQVKALRFFYSRKSSLIYSFKHLGSIRSFIFISFVYFVEPITRTMFLLLKRSPVKEYIELYKGFFMLYKDTFNIFKLGLKK